MIHTNLSFNDIVRLNRECLDLTTVPMNIGDGFLYQNNPIFRNIRDIYIGMGFGFTRSDAAEYNSFFPVYFKKLIETKKIPIIDTLSVVTNISKSKPGGKDILYSQVNRSILHNHLLHECCHLIIVPIGAKDYSNLHSLQAEREGCLALMVDEGFAIAVELIGNIFATTELHQILYKWNLYEDLFLEWEDPFRALFLKAEARLGFKTSFKIVMLALFLNQISPAELTLSEVTKIIAVVAPEIPGDNKIVFKLFCETRKKHCGIGFTLSTGLIHFGSLGFKSDISQLLNMNYFSIIKKSRAYFTRILEIGSDFAEFGIRSSYFKKFQA